MYQQVDFLGESTEGNLHLVSRASNKSAKTVLGLLHPRDILETPIEQLKAAQQVSHMAQCLLTGFL